MNPASAGFLFLVTSMQIRTIFKVSFFLFAFIFSSNSLAIEYADYVGTYEWYQLPTQYRTKKPLNVCFYHAQPDMASHSHSGHRIEPDGDLDPNSIPYRYKCFYIQTNKDTGVSRPLEMPIYRTGDISCPSGFTSIPGEARCGSCAAAKDQTVEFKGPDSPIISGSSGKFVSWRPDSDSVQCYESCEYTGQASSLCFTSPGSSDQGYCNFYATGTGSLCDAPDEALAVEGNPVDSDDPEQPEEPEQPGEPGDGDDGDNPGSGGDGGGSGGDGDDGSGGGPGGGDAGGDGSGGDGDGSGDGSGNGDGSVSGPGTSLSGPESGSFDGTDDEWDEKLEQAKTDLKDSIDEKVSAMQNLLNLDLGEGGGSLPCNTHTVFGQTLNFCLTDYYDVLLYLRNILLLMAALFAAFVILKD